MSISGLRARLEGAVFPSACLLAVALARWGAALSWPMYAVGDLPHGLGNPGIRDPRNLAFLFSPSYYGVFWEGSYHPLSTALYIANHALFGFEPYGFRAFQLGLAWAASVLIGLVGRRHLGAWAWAASVLFLAHGVQSEAVMMMLAVRDQLVVVFILAGLLIHQRSLRRGSPLSGSLLTCGCFALAALSKETGIMMPGLVLAYDLAFAGLPPRGAARTRRLLEYGLLAATAMLYAFLLWGVVGTVRGGSLLGYAPGASPASTAARIGSYLAALARLGGPPWLGPAAIALTCAAFAARGDRDFRVWTAWCAAWTALALLPVSGVLPLRALSEFLQHPQACDRYALLAAAGYGWLLAGVLRLAWKSGRRLGGRAALAGVMLLAAASAQPLQWRSWRKDLSPGLNTDSVVGFFLALPALRGRDPRAYQESRARAVASWGEESTARYEAYIGSALSDACRTLQLTRRAAAPNLAALDRGIAADAAYQDGCAHLARGRYDRAIAEFENALAEDPRLTEAERELGLTRWSAGKGGAIEHLRRSVLLAGDDQKFQPARCSCRPGDPSLDAELRAGWQKRYDEALRQFRDGKPLPALKRLDEALGADPTNAQALLSRGAVRASFGRQKDALADYDAAIAQVELELKSLSEAERLLDPDDSRRCLWASTLCSRAAAWLELGRRDRAAADIAQARSVVPPHCEVKAHLSEFKF